MTSVVVGRARDPERAAPSLEVAAIEVGVERAQARRLALDVAGREHVVAGAFARAAACASSEYAPTRSAQPAFTSTEVEKPAIAA